MFAGAFDGFVVETEASGCCGGGTSIDIFSSSSNNNGDDDPEDPEECGECGCYVEGCSDCLNSFISCGGGCECPTDPNPDPISGNLLDSCGSVCSATTDDTELCNNNCGF